MKHLLFFAVAALLSATLSARDVSLVEAIRVAERWAELNAPIVGALSPAKAAAAETDNNGTTLYYKVLFPENKLAIVTSHTHLPPLLAVIDASQLNLPRTHPLLDLLNGDATFRREVFTVATDNPELNAAISAHQRIWAMLLSDEAPTVSVSAPTRIQGWEAGGAFTHWYQESRNRYGTWAVGEVYDRYTPNHTTTGCVATAGAALLQFLNVAQGPTDITRTCRLEGQALSLTTRGGPYDWSLLPKWERGVTLTEEAKELLGRVSYDVGVCTGTWYGAAMSGSTPSALAKALPRDFGVPSTYRQGRKGSANRLSAAQHLYPTVRAGTPVLLGLMGTRSGHAALAVGLGEDVAKVPYTRLFMGWGGWYDTWYALPEVEVGGVTFPLLRDSVFIEK